MNLISIDLSPITANERSLSCPKMLPGAKQHLFAFGSTRYDSKAHAAARLKAIVYTTILYSIWYTSMLLIRRIYLTRLELTHGIVVVVVCSWADGRTATQIDNKYLYINSS